MPSRPHSLHHISVENRRGGGDQWLLRPTCKTIRKVSQRSHWAWWREEQSQALTLRCGLIILMGGKGRWFEGVGREGASQLGATAWYVAVRVWENLIEMRRVWRRACFVGALSGGVQPGTTLISTHCWMGDLLKGVGCNDKASYSAFNQDKVRKLTLSPVNARHLL